VPRGTYTHVGVRLIEPLGHCAQTKCPSSRVYDRRPRGRDSSTGVDVHPRGCTGHVDRARWRLRSAPTWARLVYRGRRTPTWVYGPRRSSAMATSLRRSARPVAVDVHPRGCTSHSSGSCASSNQSTHWLIGSSFFFTSR